MGFKSDITAYLDMINEYERRGNQMRAARLADYGRNVYTKRQSYPAYEPHRDDEYDQMGNGRDSYSYRCEGWGCDGNACGH